MEWQSDRTATLHGLGTINMAQNGDYDGVHGGGFAVIDAGDFSGHLAFAEMLSYDRDTTVNGLADLNHYTLIEGFDVAKDTVGFGNMQAAAGSWHDVVNQRETDGLSFAAMGSTYAVTSSQIAMAGSGEFSTEMSLFSALNQTLEGNVDVAYAKYTGNVDLSGIAGLHDDAQHDLYAVAYDDDGTGITSVILVQVAEGATFDGNVAIGHSVGSPV
jgi:hypothetical protein